MKDGQKKPGPVDFKEEAGLVIDVLQSRRLSLALKQPTHLETYET